MRDIKNWIKGNLYGATMKLNQFVIYGAVRTAITNKGTQKVRYYGCDGTNHAILECTEWYDVNTNMCTYATSDKEYITGPCNGSCVGKQSKGFFIIDKKGD